jgi:TRAP-type mannitol/chloroaromatic compound transport system permease large subunit
MTQSLSILMSDPFAAALLLIGLLMLTLMLRAWYRQKVKAEIAVPAGENHPAIPRSVYKLSEVAQSQMKRSTDKSSKLNKSLASRSEAYHIPPGLWDV